MGEVNPQEEQPSVEEVRVICTNDGQKWVNIDDLIISSHFVKDMFDREVDKDDERRSDVLTNKEIKKVYDFIMEALIQSFEDLNIEADEDE